MTRRSVSVEITTTLPEALPLRDAELTVLFEYEVKIREAFRAACLEVTGEDPETDWG